MGARDLTRSLPSCRSGRSSGRGPGPDGGPVHASDASGATASNGAVYNASEARCAAVQLVEALKLVQLVLRIG